MSNNISVLLDFGSEKIALKKSNFDEVVYNKTGTVTKFRIKNKWYVTTVHGGTDTFFGFLEESNYKKLLARFDDKTRDKKKEPITDAMWRVGEFTKDSITKLYLKRAEVNDKIEGCFEYMGAEGVCQRYYLVTYTGTIPGYSTFKQAANIDQTRQPFDCHLFNEGSQARKFFDLYKNYPLFDGTNSNPDPALVAEISALLASMDKVVYDSWNEFIGNPYSTDNFYKNYYPGQNVPAAEFTRADFVSYRDGLRRWLQLLDQRKEDLKKVKNMEHGKLLMLLFTMNREVMLRPLPVQVKIDTLVALVSDHALISWFFSCSQKEFFNTEVLAMNIIKSVTPSQASDFIDLLETTIIKSEVVIGEYEDDTVVISTCLYMALFKAIDDFGGENNFTSFVKTITELVKIKNFVPSIVASHPSGFTASDIATLKNNGTIKHAFFWKESGIVGKTSYKVSVDDVGNKLTIRERKCTASKTVPHPEGDGMGPSTIWYSEECASQSEAVYSNISHFGLVYVHFYDNPSFIDIKDNQGSYQGQAFFTFAGFFYYLQVKKETYWKEKIFNACLFILSVVAPFGEVVIALRNLEYLHATVGILSLAGNTAAYLTQNTDFSNYIIQKYPNDYNDIMTMLNIASILSFTNVGSQPHINSLGKDIVGKISRTEAGKYLGGARELLKDADAMALLSPLERECFEKIVFKMESELYKYRGLEDITQQILQQQGVIKYHKIVQMKAELQLLSTSEHLMFLKDFAKLEGIEKVWMEHYGGAFIRRWKNFTAAEKDIARANPGAKLKELLTYIRYETEYGQGPKVKISDLTNSYLSGKYHPEAITMRDDVRAAATTIRNTYSPGGSYGGRASVAQYYDKTANVKSQVLAAFSQEEVGAGALDAVMNNYVGASGFNPANPYLHPNIKELLDELELRRPVWQIGLTQAQDNEFYKELFRHADLRAFNDLACQRWGVRKLSRIEFDQWCSSSVLWYQELLRPSNVGGVRDFILHDPCRICYYPTILITKIK